MSVTEITNPRDQRICELYEQGLLLKTIADRVGMAPNSIGTVLKKYGYERPAKPQKRVKLSDDAEELVAKLWNEGLCASQIAERLRVGQASVSIILTKLGLSSTNSPRHRYDGIGGIGSARREKSGALQRIARRA
jgi:DNA-binding NarL/FixJ family response regulator